MFSKCKELSTPPSQTASRDTQNIYQIRLTLGVWVTKSDQVIFEISPLFLSLRHTVFFTEATSPSWVGFLNISCLAPLL